MDYDETTYRLKQPGRFGSLALIAGALGIALSAYGWFLHEKQFYFSWLVSFFFWLSIGLGGLFFVMLHHIVAARWSVVLRRLSEDAMMTIPFMAILFLPVLAGMQDLFHWTHEEEVIIDYALRVKEPYLNVGFFVVRAVIYFGIWGVLAWLLWRVSRQQDARHNPPQIERMRRISAIGLILFAFTITFASFDWFMSLDPHWYSTIFGVYVFAGLMLAIVSFLTLLTIRLRAGGVLQGVVTSEHDHDLGKLLFAFVIFWGYMAFSQYFLIWYANIPEETVWMLHRWQGSWKTVSLILIFGHFVVPFFVLFPQETKRNRVVLAIMSVWILLVHWIDIYWLAMPTLRPHGAHITWIDMTSFIGIGGVFVWLVWRRLSANPLVPISDPKLEGSIDHHQ